LKEEHAMNRRIFAVVIVGTLVAMSTPRIAAAAQPCESLTSLKLPDTTITAATLVQEGPFAPPAPTVPGPRAGGPLPVPSFCRVQLTVAPQVHIEVWMPASGWNGKFQGVGGGGFAGVIVYPALAAALRAGYATASTDTGHFGNTAEFALGHPELVVDFGYRAIHEMTLKGKQVTEAFYGAAPRESYFVGCSTGGRQGLAEAQRYPDDYDGIVSGAPAINWTHLLVSGVALGLATLKDPESYIPASKLPAINAASVAACDLTDGVKDGLVSDPRVCKFDPSAMVCSGGDTPTCLTQKQAAALKQIYDGTRFDGRTIDPGRLPGVERGWGGFITGASAGRSIGYTYGTDYMKYFVFGDPQWDYRTWDYGRDLARVDADQRNRSVMDTWNPDLRRFRDRGGKLIVYHGWGDDAISPLNTITYFRMVIDKTSGGPKAADAPAPEDENFRKAAQKTGEFMRLFMVPGMNHCGGGPGPNTFDAVTALANWVEKKQAPDVLLGSHMTDGVADLTRPLCPYPQVAQYSGQGDVKDAANFSCTMPR
jgi:Tannase and feruloyl esterase